MNIDNNNAGRLPLSGKRGEPSYALSVKITFTDKNIHDWVASQKNRSRFLNDMCTKAKEAGFRYE